MIIFPNLLHAEATKFGVEQVGGNGNTEKPPHHHQPGSKRLSIHFKTNALKLTMQNILLEADQALYESKKAGRNTLTHFANIRSEKKVSRLKKSTRN